MVQGAEEQGRGRDPPQGHTPNVLTLPDSAHLQKVLLTPSSGQNLKLFFALEIPAALLENTLSVLLL